MKSGLFITFVAFLIISPTALCQPSGDSGLKLRPMAEKFVRQCASIHKGDLVLIAGSPTDEALLEDLAVEVRKVGAFPMINVASADLLKRLGKEVPPQYATDPWKMDQKLAEIVDAAIYIGIPDFDFAMAEIPPDIGTAMIASMNQPFKRMIERNVRLVTIDNGLYPTEARAKQFGITYAELCKLFNDGMNVDYPAMAATGAKLKSILKSGRTIHITTPNGTDLTMSIRGRKVAVSDGMITPDKQKEGGTACQLFLPAGEVYLAGERGTAQGKVVFDRVFLGFEVRDLTLTVQDGKVVQMAGGSGFDRFKAIYDAGKPGKEEVTGLDFGINPNVKLPADSKVRTFIPAGSITLSFGDDVFIGGDNDCGAMFGGQLWRATVKVDEQMLIEDGQLKIK